MKQASRQMFLRKNRQLIKRFVELKIKIDAIPYCSLLAVQLENDLIQIGFHLHSPVEKISDFEIDEILQSEFNKTVHAKTKQMQKPV